VERGKLRVDCFHKWGGSKKCNGRKKKGDRGQDVSLLSNAIERKGGEKHVNNLFLFSGLEGSPK